MCMITTGGGSQSWSSNLAHADEADLDLEAFSSARAVLETWLNAWLPSASQAAAHGREAQPLPPYTHHYLRHCIVRATHPPGRGPGSVRSLAQSVYDPYSPSIHYE